jgi:hypothetical protein
MIEAQSAKRLWLNWNRRGWRTVEPLDEHISFEVPRLFANALCMMKNLEPSWIVDLCDEIGLFPTDVARYAGIEPFELSLEGAAGLSSEPTRNAYGWFRFKGAPGVNTIS